MSYPGPAGPRGSQGAGNTENLARTVAAIITVAAVVGVLLISLITKYSDADASSFQGGGSGPAVSNGGGVSVSGGSGSDSSNGGGSSTSNGGGSAAVPGASRASQGSGGGSGSGSSQNLSGDQARQAFTTPPGTTHVTEYGDKYYKAHPTTGQDWYLTSASLSAVLAYYENWYTQHGYKAVDAPYATKTNGVTTGYLLSYTNETGGSVMDLLENFLGDAPGKVLIQVSFR